MQLFNFFIYFLFVLINRIINLDNFEFEPDLDVLTDKKSNYLSL
jgi:hypothetical protein